jgi:hypothetical protein
MRVLEARFRAGTDSPFVVVGHLVWLGPPLREPALVRAAPSLAREESPATFMSKLDYLVSSTAPDCFEGLRRLRSRFWSFVEVAPSILNGDTVASAGRRSGAAP